MITYRKDKEDIQNFGWIDTYEQLTDMAYGAEKQHVSQWEFPDKDLHKAEALNEAYNMFTTRNCKKLIVLLSIEGEPDSQEEEKLTDAFKKKCSDSQNVSLCEMKMYYRGRFLPKTGSMREAWYEVSESYFYISFSLFEKLALELKPQDSRYQGLVFYGTPWAINPHPGGINFYVAFNAYRQLSLYKGIGSVYNNGDGIDDEMQQVCLSNYQYIYVSTNPEADSGGDGIPDQSELAEQIGICKDRFGNEVPIYNYRSNPIKADTDGDGIEDGEDSNPKAYDVIVAGYGDAGVIRLNTGKAFQILFSEEYSIDQFIKDYYKRYVSLDKAELDGIYLSLRNTARTDFTMEEYECIHLLDEGLMKYLVQDKSIVYKCQLFERFSGKKVLDVAKGKEEIGDASKLQGFVLKRQIMDYYSVAVKWQGVWLEYFESTVDQILLGRYSKTDGTMVGTVGQIGLAFTGADVAQDIRDLTYDVSHWECTWEHIGETALDALCLLPLVGAVAKSDEVVLFIKHTEKLYEIRRIARAGEAVEDVVKKATVAVGNIVDSAKVGMKQLGDDAYRCLLNALDSVKQSGRLVLCTEYGNDFTKAFASYGDELGELAQTYPTAVQKAYRKTIEECTDESGRVVKRADEIGEVSQKHIDEAVAVTDEEIYNAGMKVFNEFDIESAYVKPKHLATTGGNGAKFIGSSKAESEEVLRNLLQECSIVSIKDNGITDLGNPSYSIIISNGKIIGTKGETCVRIILSEDGGMLSAFPEKI